MTYRDYKYKCLQCSFINTISFEWFQNTLPEKAHNCTKCGKARRLNVAHIRQRDYNDFATVTQVVGRVNKSNKYYLKITNEEFKDFLEIPPKSEQVKIGRAKAYAFSIEGDMNAVLHLPDPYISRKHCTIHIKRNAGVVQLILKDDKSRNGTVCNGVKIDDYDQIILKATDTIIIGKTIIEITI